MRTDTMNSAKKISDLTYCLTSWRCCLQRVIAISLVIMLYVFVILSVDISFAGETGQGNEEPDSVTDDLLYTTMLRSINLDRSRWKSFSRTTASGPWFYDTQSMIKKSGRVTVNVTIYPNPHNTQLYGSIYSDHSKIRRIALVTEINCSRKTYRQTKLQAYGYDEQILSQYAYSDREQKFLAIKPASMTDTLRGFVCAGGMNPKK